MQTINSLAKFKHMPIRTGVSSRRVDVNVHIVELAMQKSLDNISLEHVPVLGRRKRQQKSIVPTREDGTIIPILKVILAQDLAMTRAAQA